MTFVVPSIVEVLMSIVLWISICETDWTAERAIIASDEIQANDIFKFVSPMSFVLLSWFLFSRNTSTDVTCIQH